MDKKSGVEKITEKGIVTKDGKQIELDLIVYSTGFDATDGVISYPVIGKNNKKLSKVWEQFPRAYLGTTIPEFPNLFIVTGPNTGVGHTSALFLIESQMNYIMQCIKNVEKQHKRAIEIKAEAEQKYTDLIHQEMVGTVWEAGGCNSWYKNKNGKIIAMFPGFSFTYRRWAKNFKKKDHLFYGDTK
jgi:cation diffusion facilitator CzcD-associated flavoprotein CzcO